MTDEICANCFVWFTGGHLRKRLPCRRVTPGECQPPTPVPGRPGVWSSQAEARRLQLISSGLERPREPDARVSGLVLLGILLLVAVFAWAMCTAGQLGALQ